MRVVGLDLGERRIGVAVSDGTGSLATPHTVVERSGDDEADRAALRAVVDELGASCVVIGLPLSLDGRPRRAAQRTQQDADALAAAWAPAGIAVETFDERFTTVSAERSLREAGRKGRARRARVDAAAAAVMLQAWLDGRRARAGLGG